MCCHTGIVSVYVYLFLILLVKRAKLLAYDWAAGCLATAHGNGEVVTKKLSVSRSSRQEMYQELKDKSENEYTKKSTQQEERFQKVGE